MMREWNKRKPIGSSPIFGTYSGRRVGTRQHYLSHLPECKERKGFHFYKVYLDHINDQGRLPILTNDEQDTVLKYLKLMKRLKVSGPKINSWHYSLGDRKIIVEALWHAQNRIRGYILPTEDDPYPNKEDQPEGYDEEFDENDQK